MRKINIFVSSDMHELECEREIVQEVLQEMNINPVLFELFPALNQSPSEAYIEEVRNCDILVRILKIHGQKKMTDTEIISSLGLEK